MDARTPVGWTLHNLVAHVAAWEAHAARRLAQYRETGVPPPFEGDVDEMNARFIEGHRLVGPEALVDELDASHRRLLDELGRLGDAQVGAHDGWVAMVVRTNTFEHYAEHAAELS